MDIAQIGRHGRTAGLAVAIAGLLTAPAVAFGAMGFGGFHGGFHGGGFHGGFHGGGHPPAPPGIHVHPKPPLFGAAPPMQFAKHDDFHMHDHFHHNDFFGCDGFGHGGFHAGFHAGGFHGGGFHRGGFGAGGCGALGWGWGGWGGGYESYPTGGAEPVYAAQAAPAPEPPPCPELLTWSPKLGRAIRTNLCNEAPGAVAYAPAPVVPRG